MMGMPRKLSGLPGVSSAKEKNVCCVCELSLKDVGEGEIFVRLFQQCLERLTFMMMCV